MALTELQLPTKDGFYRRLQGAANEMDAVMTRWKNLSEFIARVSTDDLDSMGVPLGQVRTDLSEFRTAMDEVIALYEGGSVVPTNAPNTVIDKIRSM